MTLLSHGAEPNTLDIQRSAPITHASSRDSAVCVRLLLEAGADPNLATTVGLDVGGPVSLAARHATDPAIIKTLLDFGADVESAEACDDNTTALMHASRKNRPDFVLLLLEHGADINHVNKAGHTPLTIAITFRSHEVLRLLLEKWFEYTVCPRLKGPHLLGLVALYADVEMMNILMGSDHLLYMYDKQYTVGDFAAQLKARPDATEKLILAFDDLLSVMKKGSESRRSDLEAGNMMGDSLVSSTEYERLLAKEDPSTDSDDPDERFDDTLEVHNEGKSPTSAFIEKKKSKSW